MTAGPPADCLGPELWDISAPNLAFHTIPAKVVTAPEQNENHPSVKFAKFLKHL
jgi:hypothetical protein